MSKYFLCFLILRLACQPAIFAQTLDSCNDRFSISFREAKEGFPFPNLGERQATDGTIIDCSKLHQKAFIRFGFIGCHPCEAENPTFLKLAKAFPDVLFVYISFDAPEDILKEFSEYLPPADFPKNLKLISITRKEIDSFKLTMGYPVNYFIRASGIVQTVVLGNQNVWGDGRKPIDVWNQKLKNL